MDDRPRGFFDSGLGGLTCVTHVMDSLPNERIIYFGDTARTPYGSKAESTIKKFSNQITDFLIRQDVKMIVIACNTVSATCLEELRKRHKDIPIIGIIEPAAYEIAQNCNSGNNIGVIGTKATVKSRAYDIYISKYKADLKIFSTACPAFVPLIEEGIIENEIMDLSVRHYLDKFISYNKIDTLVLGCTHYPLIKKNIEKLYPELKIVNPSKIIFENIRKELETLNGFASEKKGEHIFYASDLSENFINMINRIFKDTGFTVKFKNFEINDTAI